MPNRTKVTKEDIVEAAFRIVRAEGMEHMNARAVAKDLNISIQPVYYHFPTMNDLREAVIHEAKKLYNGYIQEAEKKEELPFKAVGSAYIQFAGLESKLFQLLFMEPSQAEWGLNMSIDENFEDILSMIQKIYGLSIEASRVLYENVWVTTHGLACMIATGFMRPTPEKISEILSRSFKGQIALEKLGDKK